MRLKALSRSLRAATIHAAVVSTLFAGLPAAVLESWWRPAVGRAATFPWFNGSGDFSLGTNWGGVAPGFDPADVLIFGGAGSYTARNDLGNDLPVSQLLLTNTGSGISTLTGGSLLFDAAGAGLLTRNGSGFFRINNGLNLGRNLLVGGTGSGGVVLAGNVSGAFGLDKSGDFTLSLLGANSFAGLNLAGGKVRIHNNDDNLGLAGGTVTVDARSTLQASGASLAASRAFVLNQNLTIESLANTSGTVAGTISGNGGLTKIGAGVLQLGGANGYAGGTTLFGGTLELRSTTASPVLSAAGAGDLFLQLGQLNLRANGAGSNGVIQVGSAGPVDMTMIGNATINVDRHGANTNNRFVIDDLRVGNNVVTVAGANAYRLRVDGTTFLNGGSAVLAPTGDTMILLGNVVSAAPGFGLTKAGAGTLEVDGNSSNAGLLTGPTNVLAGGLRVSSSTAIGTTPLGNTTVNIYGGANLRITTTNDLGFAVNVSSTSGALGAVALEASFDPAQSSVLTNPGVFASPYGGGLRIVGTNTSAVDPTALGSNVYFGAQGTATFGGFFSNFGSPVRLANDAATTVLTLNGPGGIFNVPAFVQFGNPYAHAVTLAGGSGTFLITNTSSHGTRNTIYRPSTVQVAVQSQMGSGGALGFGEIEVFGTLTLTGANGSLVDSGSFASNPLTLRPGASLIVNNAALFSGLGSRGRIDDNQDVVLNGAALQIVGHAATPVAEFIRTLTVGKGATLSLVRGSATATVGLNASSAGRDAGGTLVVKTTTNGSLGATEQWVLGDTTGLPLAVGSNGGGTAMLPAWTLNQITTGTTAAPFTATFLTLPQGAGPYVVGNAPFSPAALNAATATDLVSTNGAALTAPADVFALRTQGAVTGSTVTIHGAAGIGSGLIMQGAAATHTAGFTFLNEADVYVGNLSATSNFAAVTTQTLAGSVTAPSLVKFGLGTLILSGTNAGLTSTGYVNQGTLQFNSAAALNGLPLVLQGGNVTFGSAFRTDSTLTVRTDLGAVVGGGASVANIVIGDGFTLPQFLQWTVNTSALAIRDALQLNAQDN